MKNSNINKIELAYPRASELKPSKYKEQLLRTYRVKYNSNKLNELGNNLKKFKNEVEFVDVISVESLFYTPNDYLPLWNYWVNYDYSLDLIKAEQAWDITKDSANIKIAVIDTDFDLTHEELINQIVYDDNGDCSYSSYTICSHGTKVAGNVAGQTNNGKGKSAIGYNCKLMIYRGLSYSNITDAALDGADVINCSWGSFSYSSFNQTLINAAANEGAIIVAAAGNQPISGANITDYMYPASYDNVISVMAVDSDKKYGCINCSSTPIAASRTFIQNDKIDVASPGISVPVIIPSSSWNTDNGYTPAYENYPLFGDNGTSFSSPIVAGLIGLMLTVNPCLTTNEIEYILKQTGEAVFSLPVNSFFLQTYGTKVPLIDAYEAVKAARDFPEIVTNNTTISGSSIVCTSNSTYTINNPAGTTISWSVSPTSLFAVDSGTGSSFTTRATNGFVRGTGTITATVSGSCGSYTTTTPPKTIWVGKPASFPTPISGRSTLYPGNQEMYFSSIPNGNITSMVWSVPSGCSSGYCWNIISTQSNPPGARIQAGKIGDNQVISVKATNACGYRTSYTYVDVVASGGGGGGGGDPCATTLAASPNPANKGNRVVILKVILPPDPCTTTLTSQSSTSDEVAVTDQMGIEVFRGKPTNNQISIKTNKYKTGIYLATYLYKGTKLQKRFIVD